MADSLADKNAETGRMLDEISRGTRIGRNRPTNSNGRRRPRILPLLLVLLVLAGLGWLLLEQRGLQNRLVVLESERQQLQSELQGLEAILRSTEAEVTSTLREAELQRDADASLVMEQMEARLANLDAVLDDQARDVRWLYAEVNYLLRLADRKLLLETDVESAIALLGDADRLLARADSSSAENLRRYIAEHTRTLQAIELPDVIGWSYRLSSLVDAVDNFSVRESRERAYDETRAVTAADAAAESDPVTVLLDWLRAAIVWREWDEAPEILLTQEQETLLRHNLRLLLEQARLALLLRDDALLRSSLEQVQYWMERHFATESAAIASALQEIDELLQIELEPELPDLGPARSLAQQLAGGEGR